MTTLIVAASATRSETPRNANGALFRYAYITEREMVYADTVTELCSYLIPTYDQLVEAGDDTSMLEARVENLAHRIGIAQAMSLEQVLLQRDEALPDEVMTAVLEPKDRTPIHVDEWPLTDLPLLLLTTQYAPFTAVPRPRGAAVHFYDPRTERTFVHDTAKISGSQFLVLDRA